MLDWILFRVVLLSVPKMQKMHQFQITQSVIGLILKINEVNSLFSLPRHRLFLEPISRMWLIQI